MIKTRSAQEIKDQMYKIVDFIEPQTEKPQSYVSQSLPSEPKVIQQNEPALSQRPLLEDSTLISPAIDALHVDKAAFTDALFTQNRVPTLPAPHRASHLNMSLSPLHKFKPHYPQRAKRMGIEGYVKVELSVDAKGEVQGVKIIESAPSGVFERSVKKALMQWKFRPKILEGKSVAQKGVIQLNFNLEEE